MDQATTLFSEKTHRDGRLSLIRIVGTVMVITVHVSGMVAADANHPFRLAGMVYGAVSRPCVPLFLMVTGALLLPRTTSYGDYLYRRAARLLIPLVFWGAFYLWLGGVPASLWPEKLLTAQPEGFHLWYLYMLVNISLGLPVVGAFFRWARPRDAWMLLTVWFVVCALIPYGYVLAIDFDLPGQAALLSVRTVSQAAASGLFSPYLGYVLLGACLARARGLLGWGIAAFVVSTAAILILTWDAAMQAHATLAVDDYLTPLVILGSGGLFAACMSVEIRERPWLQWLGGCTFGIYLVHLYGIRLAATWGFNALAGNSWVTIAETDAVVFAGSLAFTAVIRLARPGRLIT